MSYQKSIIKYILSDSVIPEGVDESTFTKAHKELYKLLHSLYLETGKVPTFSDLANEIKIKSEDTKPLLSVLNSIYKAETKLTLPELIDKNKRELSLYKTALLLNPLATAIEKNDIEEIQRLLNKGLRVVAEGDGSFSTDITKTTFDSNAIATTPAFLESFRSLGIEFAGLSLIGGRSGDGKSILAMLQALYEVKVNYNPTAIYSLEMSEEQLSLRMYSHVNKTPMDKLKGINPKIIDKWKRDYFKEGELFVKHKRYNPAQLQQAILNDIGRGVKFFVIDYLNLVMFDETETWRGMQKLIYDLNEIAVKYGVVILTPTQVEISEDKNKNVYVTTRGSKDLEYASSLFLLLYSNSEEQAENISRCIVVKARNSQKATILLNRETDIMTFSDTNIIL